MTLLRRSISGDLTTGGRPSLYLHALALSVLFAWYFAAIATASGQTKSDPFADFVLGNIEYVLLHELAHVLINDLDIPIIGPEENAADYIATTVLLRADLFDPARAERARDFLLTTADGLATSWEVDLKMGREIRYWDSHALTIQRFYQIICLVYGSNPETFSALPNRVSMPPERAARCPAEFARADRSLGWLLQNYGRQPGEGPGAEVTVVMEEPPTKASKRVVDAMAATDILMNSVRRLREAFVLPRPFQISVRRCRARQAAWLSDARELVLCYELFDNYYMLGLQRDANKRQGSLGKS